MLSHTGLRLTRRVRASMLRLGVIFVVLLRNVITFVLREDAAVPGVCMSTCGLRSVRMASMPRSGGRLHGCSGLVVAGFTIS